MVEPDCGAVVGNTITIGAIDASDLTFSTGSVSGSGSAGGALTIKGPAITISSINLSGFTYEEGSGPSTEQSFTVSGADLFDDIVLTAPTNYEISTSSGSGFTNSITLTESGGIVSNTAIYVRLKSGLSIGTFNDEDITLTSQCAASKTVECDGSVTAIGAGGGACASDLIISEYGEGSTGNSKYVEIYNGTGSSVTLSNYRIWTISNGGTWPEATYDFTTVSLADGETLVIANNSTDVPGADEYSGTMSWNGDDAVGLAKNDGGWTLIDAVGEDGADPGSGWEVAGTSNATVDKRLTRKETIVVGNTDWDASRGTNVDNSEWTLTSYTSGAAVDGHTMTCGPTIIISPSTLTGLNYIVSNGPSAEQSFTISGTNLTADISIDAPTNYEISTGTGGSFVATDPIVLTQVAGEVSATTIYVRLKAGLSAGDYNSETITATSTDATDKTVTCSGTVSTPDVTASVASLTGFSYIFGNGPSTSQSFTVSGTSLTADIVVTAPANYEVSDDDATFGASVSLTPVSNTVASTTIYVRLKTGLAIGEYNLEDITISSTGATNETL